MTIVHPPSVEEDTDTIEALDWAPPCEYSAHRRIAPGASAVWAVTRSAAPCCGGAPRPDAIQYYCDPCWTYRNHLGECLCRQCGAISPSLADVIRVERI